MLAALQMRHATSTGTLPTDTLSTRQTSVCSASVPSPFYTPITRDASAASVPNQAAVEFPSLLTLSAQQSSSLSMQSLSSTDEALAHTDVFVEVTTKSAAAARVAEAWDIAGTESTVTAASGNRYDQLVDVAMQAAPVAAPALLARSSSEDGTLTPQQVLFQIANATTQATLSASTMLQRSSQGLQLRSSLPIVSLFWRVCTLFGVQVSNSCRAEITVR